MPHSRIVVLDAFRALAIIAVLFYHLGFLADLEFAAPPTGAAAFWAQVFSYGWLGVEFFFMISGFVIFMTLARVDGPLDFAVRRFARLYPAYIVCAGIVYLVTTLIPYAPNQHSLYDLMIAPLVDAPFFHADYLSAAYWSLVAEARFYFWICIVYALFPGRFEIAWCLFCIVGYVFVLAFAPAYSDVVGGEYLPFFTLGIAFYMIFDGKSARKGDPIQTVIPGLVPGIHAVVSVPGAWMAGTSPAMTAIRSRLESSWFDWRAALLFAIAALGIGLFWSTENHGSNPAIMILIILSFVGLFALFLGKRLDFIATRPLLFLGRISYALYLVHLEIGISLIYWLRLHHMPDLLADLIALLAVIALAQVISVSVEAKGKDAIMGWFVQWKSIAVRAPPAASAE